MKIICPILLLLLTLPHTWAADPVSVDDFKQITNASDRAKLIEQAPPEQRDELKKIDAHLQLLAYVGGEAGLKALRESSAAKARGFEELEGVFRTEMQIWNDYRAGVDGANEKSGMTREQLVEVDKKEQADQAAMFKRLDNVHSLVFNLAASPQASQLEKKAEKVGEEMESRFGSEGSTPKQRVTKKEWLAFQKQMDDIHADLQAMPKLTPEQAQKESDAITDDKVRPW